MKKFIYIIVLFFTCFLEIKGQNNLFIYNSDQDIGIVDVSRIDSITYYKSNDSYQQFLWINNTIYSQPVNDINRVSFVSPDRYVVRIPEESLGIWDDGFYTSNNYSLTLKRDSTDKGYICLINDFNNNVKSYLFFLNEHFMVTKIITDNAVVTLDYDSKNYAVLITSTSKNGELVFCEEYILPNIAHSQKLSTNANILGDLGNAIYGIDLLDKALNVIGIYNDLEAGDWDKAINGIEIEVATGLIGGAIGGVPGTIVGLISGDLLNKLISSDNEDERIKLLLGNSSAQIKDIKQISNDTYDISVDVTNLASRPKGTVKGKQVDVIVGLLIRDSYPTVNFKYYTFASNFKDMKSDGTIHFEIKIPNANRTYYVVPTIVPISSTLPITSFSRFGSVKEIEGKIGNIKQFNQFSAERINSPEADKVVKCQVSVNAAINSLDNIEEWGVYVYNYKGDGMYEYYPSEYKNAKIEDWLDLDFTIKSNEFDKIDNTNFKAIKEVQVGVYSKIKNPTGTFDYDSYFYSEPQKYELIYDQKPRLKFISATVNGTDILDESEEGWIYFSTEHTISYEVEGSFWLHNLHLAIPSEVTDNVGLIDIETGDGIYTPTYYYSYRSTTSIQMFLYLVGDLETGGTIVSDNMLFYNGNPVTSISILNGTKNVSKKDSRNIKHCSIDKYPCVLRK